MNKTVKFLLLTIAFFGLNNVFAQGLYINFNSGYGFKAGAEYIDYYNFQNSVRGTTSITYEQVFVSLGQGVNFDGSLGFMLNKNIGMELGLSYLFGTKNKAKKEYNDGYTDYSLSSDMLRIIPSLVISSDANGLNPYAKLGLVVGKGSILYEYIDNDDGDITTLKQKLYGGTALGIKSAIGLSFSLQDNLSLFSEVQMINMSYSPLKGTIIEATENGQDQLPEMSVRDKEIVFLDTYTWNLLEFPPDTQPREELKQRFPFGSVGLNFGLRLSL